MPMLFTSAGSYAYKLLVPLLLIDILVRMHKKDRKLKILVSDPVCNLFRI